MKIRHGWVSNSSSSSFMIIGSGPKAKIALNEDVLRVPENFGGVTEFGWEPKDIWDFGSRINWSYLQALYSGNRDFMDTLERVLKRELNVVSIEWNLSDDYELTHAGKITWAYIDHQSIGGNNLQMFDSEASLVQFLFNNGSYIHTDNDNH